MPSLKTRTPVLSPAVSYGAIHSEITITKATVIRSAGVGLIKILGLKRGEMLFNSAGFTWVIIMIFIQNFLQNCCWLQKIMQARPQVPSVATLQQMASLPFI